MESEQAALLLQSAELAARAAGELLSARWQEPKQVWSKGFRDWVTDTDLAAQQLITGFIRARHPDHAFLAEEDTGRLRAEGRVRWIIDPIDGTTNFSRQQPNFCVSIAAATAEATIAAVIYDPLRNELFSATAGGAANLDGAAIAVGDEAETDNAVVGLDWAHSAPARQATLDSLQRSGHHVRSLRTLGSAALALAWVAAGRLDAYWSWQLNVWDMAAAALIVERAGGRCTTIGNEPLSNDRGASSCLAANDRLHRALQAFLIP